MKSGPTASQSARWTRVCPLLLLACAASVPQEGHGQETGGASRLTVTADGPEFLSRVTGIDARWNVVCDTDREQRVLSAADLVTWGAASDWRQGALVVLADGGLLVAPRIASLSSQGLLVESPLWDQALLPLESLAGVVLWPPANLLERDRLVRRLREGTGAEDRALLDNGDIVAGVIGPPASDGGEDPGQADVQAAFGETLTAIHLETPAGALTLDATRVVALQFNPSLRAPAAAQQSEALLGLRDGSLLSVRRVAARIGSLELILVAGPRLSAPPDLFWEHLILVQPLAARTRYLSDMQPLGHRSLPLLESKLPFVADGNVLGGRLRSGGAVYAKGLGVHSTSRLAYDLAGGWRRFEAELALDDLAAAGPVGNLDTAMAGSVVFRVLLENTAGQWSVAYESPVVRGGDAPLPVSVELAGSRRLALIVEFADWGDTHDYANWLSARLVR